MNPEARIIELEMKVAFLENLVESLSDSVTELSEHWRAGSEANAALLSRLKRLEQVAGPEILDGRPPHY